MEVIEPGTLHGIKPTDFVWLPCKTCNEVMHGIVCYSTRKECHECGENRKEMEKPRDVPND